LPTLEALQTSVHKLVSISKCVLEIATNRTEAMTFRGRGTIRRQLVANNKPRTVTWGAPSHMRERIVLQTDHQNFTDWENQVRKPSKAQQQTRLRLYNSLAIPTLLFTLNRRKHRSLTT